VPKPRQRIRRFCFRYATPIYLGIIGIGTLSLTGAAIRYAYAHGAHSRIALAVVALLTIVPASELVIQVVQRVISYLIPPRRLPRLEFERVPEDTRTMVIVPTMLEDVAQGKELLAHLEVQALGNVDPRIHFALLTDFRDAVSEVLPRDEAILAEARRGIAALNAKHAEDGVSRFFLFHRQRLWNDREGVWMGWERKRGKIEEFNQLLRGSTTTSFVVTEGDLRILPQIRYCITLDTDTRLPRDVARQLIGIIAHPLNRARFDPARGRVVEGYGILQPRISVTYTSAAGRCLPGCTRVIPASIRTRRRCPTPTRTCTAKASLRGRDSTTSTPSTPRSPVQCQRTPSCRTTCSRGSTRAWRWFPTSSWSTSIRRACWLTHADSIAGFGATGRFSCGCSRSCRRSTA
jgi:hypothetical protein